MYLEVLGAFQEVFKGHQGRPMGRAKGFQMLSGALQGVSGVFHEVSRGTRRSPERFKGVPGVSMGYHEVSGASKIVSGSSQV